MNVFPDQKPLHCLLCEIFVLKFPSTKASEDQELFWCIFWGIPLGSRSDVNEEA